MIDSLLDAHILSARVVNPAEDSRKYSSTLLRKPERREDSEEEEDDNEQVAVDEAAEAPDLAVLYVRRSP